MRRGLVISLAVLAAALSVSAAAVFAYDHAHRDEIAPGITVAGIAIGGMDADEARATLARRLLSPLADGVSAAYGARTFRLSAHEAHIGADINGMVEAALERSRRGGILERTLRGVSGGKVIADLPARVTYSHQAVGRLMRRVTKALNEPAKDWSVKADGDGLHIAPGRSGRAVDTASLRSQVTTVISTPGAARTVPIRVRRVTPRVTRRNLAGEYPAFIVVNRTTFRLKLYKRLKLVKTYGVAVGQVGLETPAGLYHIQDKATNPAWHVPDSAWAGKLAGKVIPPGDPQNPIKARWMGIYAGAGIHGTSADGSIGSAASHGCIRMHIPDVIELYDEVPVKTPVYIA